MELNNCLEKVLYIKNEKMYYYFVMIYNKDVFYGSWRENEIPNGRYKKAQKIAWDKFFQLNNDENLVIEKIEKHPKECSFISKNLIKSLFTGWLL